MKTWAEFYKDEITWKKYLEKLSEHSYYMDKII